MYLHGDDRTAIDMWNWEKKNFHKSNIYLFHQNFFPNKEKSNAQNTWIRSSKLGWMNAADGMSLPVSNHFGRQSQINFLISFMGQLISKARKTLKIQHIYEVLFRLPQSSQCTPKSHYRDLQRSLHWFSSTT